MPMAQNSDVWMAIIIESMEEKRLSKGFQDEIIRISKSSL